MDRWPSAPFAERVLDIERVHRDQRDHREGGRQQDPDGAEQRRENQRRDDRDDRRQLDRLGLDQRGYQVPLDKMDRAIESGRIERRHRSARARHQDAGRRRQDRAHIGREGNETGDEAERQGRADPRIQRPIAVAVPTTAIVIDWPTKQRRSVAATSSSTSPIRSRRRGGTSRSKP
jgi:hypothetical protein